MLPIDWLEPQIVNDFAVVSFCPYVLDAVRLTNVPRKLGITSICSAYHLARINHSGKTPRPAAWVPARQTDANIISKLGPRTLRTCFDRVHATITNDTTTDTTHITINHRTGEPHFRADLHAADKQCSVLFEQTETFAEFFTAATTSWAPGPINGSVMQLDLDAGATRYSPLSVTNLSAPGAGRGATIDSAFIRIDGSYCWSCAGIRQQPATATAA